MFLSNGTEIEGPLSSCKSGVRIQAVKLVQPITRTECFPEQVQNCTVVIASPFIVRITARKTVYLYKEHSTRHRILYKEDADFKAGLLSVI